MKSRAILSSSIDHLVYKHNNLIESRYELNKIEQRLILLAIIVTRLNNKNGCLTDNRKIELSVDDYMMIYGVDLTTAYHAMNDAIDSLYEKSFTPIAEITDYDEPPLYHWLGHKGKRLSEGVVEFSFSEKALEYIVDLQNNFTSYSIANVRSFNCEYSSPLYELVIKMRNTQERATRIYSIDEVRGFLGVKDSHHREKDDPTRTKIAAFRRSVLERAIEDINTLSDIRISYEFFKTGKFVTGIQFSFEYKSKEEISLITIGDETKSKAKTKKATSKKTASKKTTEPDPAQPSQSTTQQTNDEKQDEFLGTDITQDDLNSDNGSRFAINYKDAVKAVPSKDEKAKPVIEAKGPIALHQYTSYTNHGGTLTYDQLCEKYVSSGMSSAPLFILSTCKELKEAQA